MPMFDFSQKTVLVAGAGRDLGKAIALEFGRRGAHVVCVSRTLEDVESVARSIESLGTQALALRANLLDESEVGQVVQTTLSRFGRVDILVNNAGGRSRLAPFEELQPEAWWSTIEANLKVPYLACRAVLPPMREQAWGRIVNIGSTASKVGQSFLTSYCTAKHGLIGLTRSLAMEVAKTGITVNAVCPGYVKTDKATAGSDELARCLGVSAEEAEKRRLAAIPQGSAMSFEDVVPGVLYLASDEAAKITGEALNISGGRAMQ